MNGSVAKPKLLIIPASSQTKKKRPEDEKNR